MKPKKFVNEIVEIPPELKVRMRDVIIHMDPYWVSNCKFLGSITKPIFYQDAKYLENSMKETFFKGLDVLF